MKYEFNLKFKPKDSEKKKLDKKAEEKNAKNIHLYHSCSSEGVSFSADYFYKGWNKGKIVVEVETDLKRRQAKKFVVSSLKDSNYI